MWISQVWLMFMMYIDPSFFPNSYNKEQMERGVSINLFEFKQLIDQPPVEEGWFGRLRRNYKATAFWLLERNFTYILPVRYFFTEFMSYATFFVPILRWEKPVLMEYDIIFMTWREALSTLVIEILIFLPILGLA